MKKVFRHSQFDQERFKIVVKLNRADIFYFTTTIETYEGIAVPRTLDQERGLVELLTTKSLSEDLIAIVKAIGNELKLEIITSI